MPRIYGFACDRCDFRLPNGWGGGVYAVNDCGKRVACPHPGEHFAIARITRLNYDDAVKAGRTGFNSNCICLACVKQFDLDVERDARLCSHCASAQVKTLWEMVDRPCPKCTEGTVRKRSPIRWKLDGGRTDLPVPRVVKDLVEFDKTRKLTPALAPLHAAAIGVPGAQARHFRAICSHLLSWWEGDFAGELSGAGTEPKDCGRNYDARWPWVRAFRLVVRESPELAGLVEWNQDRFCFRPGVSPETRRGIENYIREHREHWFGA